MTVFVPRVRRRKTCCPTGATADGEEKAPGSAWRALAPWCLEGLCGPAGPKGGGCSPQSPPVLDHYVWPLSPVLILTKDKWARKKSGTSPGVWDCAVGPSVCNFCGGSNSSPPIWILSDPDGRHQQVNNCRSDKDTKISWLTGSFPAAQPR